MKYSQSLVWKAIGEFLPKYTVARENGVHMNLPQSLKDAAVEAFLWQFNQRSRVQQLDRLYATLVIKTALEELHSQGWMEFGDVEEYWM